MDEQLKKRLVGAAVLASLAVIFLPMILSDGRGVDELAPVAAEIPPWPDQEFHSQLLKNEVPSAEPIPVPVKMKTSSGQKEPLATAPRVGLSSWVIQAGSFSEIENARKLVIKLRKAGLDTMDPEQIEIRGKLVYRVRVGPEIEKENAEKLLPRIKKISGLAGKIRRYP